MSIPLDKSEQTELPETIKLNWSGRLRNGVGQRWSDYVNAHQNGGEPGPDADPYSAAAYRTVSEYKTKVVIETAEEAYAFYGSLAHYTDARDITWLNPMSAKSARRLRGEVLDALNGMDGVEAERSGITHIDVEVSDD